MGSRKQSEQNHRLLLAITDAQQNDMNSDILKLVRKFRNTVLDHWNIP